jgi:hypothetical protein
MHAATDPIEIATECLPTAGSAEVIGDTPATTGTATPPSEPNTITPEDGFRTAYAG